MPVSILKPRIFFPASRSIQHQPDVRAEVEGIDRSSFRYFRPEFVASREVKYHSTLPFRESCLAAVSPTEVCNAIEDSNESPSVVYNSIGVTVVVLHVRQSHPAGPTPEVIPQVLSPG